MLKLIDIKKEYHMGHQVFEALKGINVTIDQGEFVAIVGTSGSGKTTVMNIMGLLDRPTAGTYFLDDIDTSSLSSDALATLRNRRLGFIFQQYFLLPKLSAMDNVLLPLSYRSTENWSLSERKERASAMLDQVGMLSFAHHMPTELSGGQQQRVAIARALVGEPGLVLADEPTGALDSTTSQQVMDLLIEKASQTRATVVVITHSNELAAQCPRAIRIQDGAIVEGV